MGRREIKGLKTRVERECSISRQGLDCTVELHMSESEERVTMLRVGTQHGGSSKSESYQEF